MSSDLSLTIDNTTKSLEAWGIGEGTLTEVNRGSGTLELVAVNPIANNAIMATGDQIILRQNGVPKWAGECVISSPGWSGSSAVRRYRINGHYFFLDRQTFRQKVLDLTADPIAPVDPVEWTNDVILFQDEAAERSTTIAQLTEILSQTTRLELGDVSSMADLDPLGQEGKSLSLLEAVNRVLNYHPKAVTRVNPTGNLDILENFDAYNIPLTQVADSLTITPRPDLQLKGVVLTYKNALVEGPAIQDVIDSAGLTEGEGVVPLEYDLGGVSVAPSGIAAHWLSQYQSLPYEVEFMFVDNMVIGDHLGKAVNVTGSEWSNIGAPIQRVTYNLFARTTAVQAGPLPTQSLDDMIELLRLRRYEASGDGGRAGTQEPFEPETPGLPWTSYKISPTSFKISPGYIGAASLSNPDSTYSGSGECWIRVDVDDDGGATSCSVSSGGSPPSPSDSTAIIPLNTFFTEDGEVNVNDGLSGNKAFFSIGTSNGHLWI